MRSSGPLTAVARDCVAPPCGEGLSRLTATIWLDKVLRQHREWLQRAARPHGRETLGIGNTDLLAAIAVQPPAHLFQSAAGRQEHGLFLRAMVEQQPALLGLLLADVHVMAGRKN